MTDYSTNNSWDHVWFDEMAARISRQRERAEELLSESENQMLQFESHLLQQLDEASREFEQASIRGSAGDANYEGRLAALQALSDGTMDPVACDEELASLRERVRAAEAELDRVDSEWRSRYEALESESGDVSRMQEQLEAALRQLEQKNGAAAHAADQPEFRELQRRFELAVADIRELKEEKAELIQQLSQQSDSEPDGASSWEVEKRRMLNALENDLSTDPVDDEERLTVEGTIRITDQVVAEKDREIQELRLLLDQQSNNIGGVAVGAAAIAEMLDNDELIQQERSRISELEQEWKDKLRQAEIDISLERAKLARERVELEEQLRQIERQTRTYRDMENPGPSPEPPTTKKKTGWLSQLGFSRSDEEES